jgi:hypothetical protein
VSGEVRQWQCTVRYASVLLGIEFQSRAMAIPNMAAAMHVFTLHRHNKVKPKMLGVGIVM